MSYNFRWFVRYDHTVLLCIEGREQAEAFLASGGGRLLPDHVKRNAC